MAETTPSTWTRNDDATHLRYQRDEAMRTSMAKTQLLTNIVDKLAPTVRGLLAITTELGERPGTVVAADTVEAIDTAALQMIEALDLMAGFMHFDDGQLTLDLQPVDLRAVVDDALEPMRATANTVGVELDIVIAAECPTRVLADSSRLEHVLGNVVDHALSAADGGVVRVEVGVVARHGDDVVVRFTVEDDGIPEDAAGQRALFSLVEGDGDSPWSGLALTRYLASRMGGSVGVDLGDGFTAGTVWVTIPFDVLEDSPAGAEASGAAAVGELVTLVADAAVEAVGTPPAGDTADAAADVATPDAAVVDASGAEPAAATDESIAGAAGAAPEPVDLADVRCLVVAPLPGRAEIAEAMDAIGVDYAVSENGVDGFRILREIADVHDGQIVVVFAKTLPDIDGVGFARAVRSAPHGSRARLVLVPPAGHHASPDALLDAVAASPVSANGLTAALHAALGDSTDDATTDATTSAASARSRRVLVAEDNPIAQAAAARLLDRLGFSYDCVDDGASALATFVPGKYRAVMVDLSMPVRNGYQVAAALRMRERGTDHHTTVIAMAASRARVDRGLADAAGIDHVVAKPLRPRECAEILDSVGGDS